MTDMNLQRMELLYEKYYMRLYLYAQTFLNDEEEAKDIVEDVFQAVWEGWKKDPKRLSSPLFRFLLHCHTQPLSRLSAPRESLGELHRHDESH